MRLHHINVRGGQARIRQRLADEALLGWAVRVSALVSASYNLALLGGPPLGVLLVSGLPPLVPCLLWAGGMMSLIVVAVLTR